MDLNHGLEILHDVSLPHVLSVQTILLLNRCQKVDETWSLSASAGRYRKRCLTSAPTRTIDASWDIRPALFIDPAIATYTHHVAS